MQIKIRSKLILAISLLMVAVFSFAAMLFIGEKKTEMANDIYHNVLAFSSMTVGDVVEDYDLYLSQGAFVYFNKEIQSLFEKNDLISAIKIISYAGELLYDSEVDVDRRFEGESRLVDGELLEQIRSEWVSLKGVDGRVVFLKTGDDAQTSFVDKNESVVEAPATGALFDFLAIPASEKYSVIYKFSYHSLDARIAVMMERIIYLAVFGVLLGILLSFVMSSKITKPVARLVDGVNEIAKGDFKVRVDVKTNDEIGFLGEAFNGMAKDLEASLEAKLYKERVAHELELAAEIQKQIIPNENEIPKIDGIDIAAGLVSAEEIGGDMYDFLYINKDKLLMYLGDVTGHGVPAGIVSSISSALFYGYCGFEDLKKIIVTVNRVLKVKTMPNMFMTLCLMEWNAATKKFSYVNAGHEQLLHYSAKQKKVGLAPSGGMALGMVADISGVVKVEEIDFDSGDFIIVYSDGIPEAWRNEKETYGMDRFMKTVRNSSGVGTADEMKEAILDDVKKFSDGHKQMDDITLIVLRRT